MRTLLHAVAPILLLALATSATADVLETRDGRAIEGTFRGATHQVIHFEVGGTVQSFRVTEVRALAFAETRASAAPTAAAAPRATRMRTLRVPAGTRLRVQMADSLDARHSAVDDRFAALLQTSLVVDGVMVAPANSKVYGKVAEAKTAGPVGSHLKLELTELMIRGQTVKILTGTHQLVEAAAADGAPASAAPAAEAAAVHAGRIPGGSLLEFRLLQPFEVGVR